MTACRVMIPLLNVIKLSVVLSRLGLDSSLLDNFTTSSVYLALCGWTVWRTDGLYLLFRKWCSTAGFC